MLVALGLFCVLILFIWWRASVNIRRDLPPAYPGALPLIGHAHLLLGDGKYLWNLIEDLSRFSLVNGGVSHLRLGPQLHYVICDPEDYFKVMDVCVEKNYWYRKILGSWIGEGLVTASVPVWKRHQKLLYPAFGQHVADGYIHIYNKQARSLVTKLASFQGKGEFEHLPIIARSAMEGNFQTAFGLELDEYSVNQMEKYIRAFKEILETMTTRIQTFWMHSDAVYSWTELKRRQEEAFKVTRALAAEIIKKKRVAMAKNADTTQNIIKNGKRLVGFIDLLLNISAGGVLSDEEIRWHVETMIVAGYDTSSTTVSYACMLLGSYPEVQEKLYQELQEVFGGSDRDVEKADLSRLAYLDAVVKEVGRLYPAAPLLSRHIAKNVELKNYTMPAGSNCVVLFSGIHRHKIWGQDSEEFRPERWLDPTSLPNNANAFTGFSTGRRACIGKPFAINYIKVTLAHLLLNYKITADRSKMHLKLQIFLKPDDGCLVTLERRNSTTDGKVAV